MANMITQLETYPEESINITIPDSLESINVNTTVDNPVFTLTTLQMPNAAFAQDTEDRLAVWKDTSTLVNPDFTVWFDAVDDRRLSAEFPVEVILNFKDLPNSKTALMHVVFHDGKLVVTKFRLSGAISVHPDDIKNILEKLGIAFESTPVPNDAVFNKVTEAYKVSEEKNESKVLADAQAREIAEKKYQEGLCFAAQVYEDYLKILEASGRLNAFQLDQDLFEDPAHMAEISKKTLLDLLVSYYMDKGEGFAEYVATSEFKAFLVHYVDNVVVGHNATSTYNVDAFTYISGAHDDGVRKAFGVKKSTPYLSAVLVDPTTEHAKLHGIGWKGDLFYTFSIEDVAPVSVVVIGDFDSSAGHYHGDDPTSWGERYMLMPDAIFHAALNQLELNALIADTTSNQIPRKYDEVMYFGHIKLDPSKAKVINTGAQQRTPVSA